jgi:S-layer family protein
VNRTTPTFRDVPVTSPFSAAIETAAAHGVISGYTCGAPGEACPGVYFRASGSATRGQISKILYKAVTGP